NLNHPASRTDLTAHGGPHAALGQALTEAQNLALAGAGQSQVRPAKTGEVQEFFAGGVAAVQAVEQWGGTEVVFPVLGAGEYGWNTMVALQVLLAALDAVRTSTVTRVDVIFMDAGVNGVAVPLTPNDPEQLNVNLARANNNILGV